MRKEEVLNSCILFDAELNDEERIAKGREPAPALWFYGYKFNVKRSEPCYAEAWAFQFDLLSGKLRLCYCSSRVQNIYADVNVPIVNRSVGCSWGSMFCMNSSHFYVFRCYLICRDIDLCRLEGLARSRLVIRMDRGFWSEKLADDNVEASALRKACCIACGRCENMYCKPRARSGQVMRTTRDKKQ